MEENFQLCTSINYTDLWPDDTKEEKMDEKKFATSASNVKSEMESKGIKSKSEPEPCASPYQDPGLTFADGEGNETNDGYLESIPHSDHDENVCYLVDDKVTDSCDDEVQRLLDSVLHSESSDQVEVEEASTVVQTTPSPQSSDDEIHVMHQNKQYSLNEYLLLFPRATGFFTVKMQDGVAVAFTLHCSSEEELPNLDASQGPVVPVEQHFHSNRNRTGYFVYTVSCMALPYPLLEVH